MNTIEAIKNRRSVRAYQPDPVPEELLAQVLEAGTWAPSGMGKQAPVILAITSKEARDELSALNAQVMGRAGMDPFYGAPVVLVVLAKKDVPTYVHDGSVVAQNMMLAAEELGLATCFIFRAKQELEGPEGRALLVRAGIDPDEYEGVANVILGYGAGPVPQPMPRKENWVYRL